MSDANSKPKPTGTPFAGPSSKPWLVRTPAGAVAAIAQTITLLFRHHFGERYLNTLSLPKGMLCFASYLLAMRLYAIGGKHSIEVPIPIISWLTWLSFAATFLLLASFHMFAAVKRRHMLRDEFSHSAGQPWPFLLKLPLVHDEWDFERFYEPAIIIAAGGMLLFLHNWFGPYLIIAGVCAFRVAMKKHQLRRGLELNVLDTRTEAANIPKFDTASGASTVTHVASGSQARHGSSSADNPFERLKANNPDLARRMKPEGDGQEEGGQ